MRTAKCTEPGCDLIAHARLLCRNHYARALAANVLPPLVMKAREQGDEERFFSRIAESEGGCWQWIAGLSDTGYGSFTARESSASNAHRWAFEFFFGEIPKGLVLDHLCRNRACVNPWHLDVVTHRVNIARGEAADGTRRRAAALTHCPHGHEKSEANTYRSYNPKYNRWECVCRPCRNARLRRNAAQKKAV